MIYIYPCSADVMGTHQQYSFSCFIQKSTRRFTPYSSRPTWIRTFTTKHVFFDRTRHSCGIPRNAVSDGGSPSWITMALNVFPACSSFACSNFSPVVVSITKSQRQIPWSYRRLRFGNVKIALFLFQEGGRQLWTYLQKFSKLSLKLEVLSPIVFILQ